MIREGFPDLRATVEDALTEGDRAAARVKVTGTHDGEYMGIPASGKRIEIETIDIVRVADGKCVEHCGITDNMSLMQQIRGDPAGGAHRLAEQVSHPSGHFLLGQPSA
jgi:predicted ester cyclase